MEVGFSESLIEGDNAAVMKVVSRSLGNRSLLGHIYADIQCYFRGL